MIKYLFIFVLCGSCLAQTTPTLVQWVDLCEMGNSGQSVASGSNITAFLHTPSLAGNFLVCPIRVDATSITGITDDKNNTWLKATNTLTGRRLEFWYATNCAAGTRRINIQVNGDTVWFTGGLGEFARVASFSPFDVGVQTGGDSQSGGGSITSGSITPTTSGDLIFNLVANANNFEKPSLFTLGTAGSPNITWQFLSSDVVDVMSVAYGVYNSTASINPATTVSSGPAHVDAMAVAFKPSASAGTIPPAGMRVLGMFSATLGTGGATSWTIQVPVSGNLTVIECNAGNEKLTAVPTDNQGATWFKTGADPTISATTNYVQIFYRTNAASTNTLLISFTLSSNGSDMGVNIFDVIGAAAYPFTGGSDDVLASGNQVGAGDNTMLSINPSSSSGLAFAVNSISFETVTNVNSPWLQVGGFLPRNDDGNTPYFENNGYAIYPVTSTGSTPFTCSFEGGMNHGSNPNVGDWSARAAFFRAQQGGSAINLSLSGRIGISGRVGQ